ncbi:hypothetical protein [Providencia sp. Je.9.19]
MFCDTKERKCHVDRYFDNGQRSLVYKIYTEKLFSQ